MNCKNCRFWTDVSKTTEKGSCCRRAPVAQMGTLEINCVLLEILWVLTEGGTTYTDRKIGSDDWNEGIVGTYFPRTYSWQWCGDFEQRAKKTK